MQTFLNVGVDIAKDAVVVACAAQSFPVHSVTNQRAPLLAWLKSLPAGSRIGLESTGSYHELLADLAQAQGHIVFLLNPLLTRPSNSFKRHILRAGLGSKKRRVPDCSPASSYDRWQRYAISPWYAPALLCR